MKKTSMTFKYVLDSHAWIEYFKGTLSGEKAKYFLETQECITPAIVVAELSYKYSTNNEDFEKQLNFILGKSSIIDLNSELALSAGKIKKFVRKKYKNNFGLADAIILATARKINAKVVTGDHHFKLLKNVEFLE
ncbi:MAG: type II toxin-antitoxin system VapC family toxin [Candidatus Diapherotrites archaeon]|nr:type II toxin-antitoxin system VapC family toxin [Candidatus Diapherotrites archaeon]